MGDTSAENTSVRAAPPSREVRVVNWPLRDDPLRTLTVGAFCVAVGVVSGLVSASWSMGVLASGALGVAWWRLWVPIVCDMGPTGITLGVWRRRRHIAWRDIHSVRCESRGVFLCGPGATHWARGWRSLYLPWRRQAQLVADFYAYYDQSGREPVRSPDTSLH